MIMKIMKIKKLFLMINKNIMIIHLINFNIELYIKNNLYYIIFHILKYDY